MKPFVLHTQAKRELNEAHAFYHECSPLVGRRFMLEFERAQSFLADYPLMYPKCRGRTRACVFRTFPYTLIYRDEPDRILVVAIAHQSRRPGYWSGRR